MFAPRLRVPVDMNLNVLSIGEIADRFGLATHVLRHWEDVGLPNPIRNVPDGGDSASSDSHDTRRRPSAILETRSLGACPTGCGSRNSRLTKPTCDTTATESLPSPDASTGNSTLPGNASSATFDVSDTTRTVAIWVESSHTKGFR